MNQERHTFKDVLRHKRTAAAVLIGVSALALTTAYITEHSTMNLTLEHARIAPEPPEITMLKRYERETGVAPRMMEFITMPSNNAEARLQAASMAATLKAWSASETSPIVIMEPTFDSGTSLDLTDLEAGKYDSALNTYFGSLKDAGVTDVQMGTWVPLPEPNIPTWKDGVTSPETFDINVTKIAGVIKKHFPSTPVSIMLDSKTYLPSPDPKWNNGTTSADQLLKYLNIQPGLIDSVGLQGFTSSPNDEPADYLNGKVAAAAAKKLGVKHVWFNTGTYAKSYNPSDPKSPLTATGDRRSHILMGILTQAQAAQDTGLQVDFINIFAENTYNGQDGNADFRYSTPEDLSLLHAFVKDANQKSIPVTIFDAPKR